MRDYSNGGWIAFIHTSRDGYKEINNRELQGRDSSRPESFMDPARSA